MTNRAPAWIVVMIALQVAACTSSPARSKEPEATGSSSPPSEAAGLPPLPSLSAAPTMSVMRYVPATSASAMMAMVAPPYTPADLEKLYRVGFAKTIQLTIQDPKRGTATLEETLEVLAHTADGYRFRSVKQNLSKKGEPSKEREDEESWEAMGRHAEDPWPAGTMVGEQTIEVKAGSFRCRVYRGEQQGDGGTVRRTAYYSLDHPGLQVLSVDQHPNGDIYRLELTALRLEAP